MTDIEIRDLSIDDMDAVDGWHDTLTASWAQDLPLFPTPSKPSLILDVVLPPAARRRVHLTARVDDRVVGTAELTLPFKDNLHLLEFEMDVHPEYRRRGVGSALLKRVEEIGAAEGRTTFITYAPDQMRDDYPKLGAGKAFLTAHGYTAGLDEVHRAADLDLVPEAELDELLAKAWAKADGYELVQWANVAPDDVVDGIAYLDGRLNTDAPMGDLDMEAEKVDRDRIRAGERREMAAGGLKLHTAVRHVESGTVAGWTFIQVQPGMEEHAWQGITIVDPEHRGHRIGTILKIANHRYARSYRPRLKYVHTWNAEENDFMISINEAVGYRAQERWIAFQKKTAK